MLKTVLFLSVCQYAINLLIIDRYPVLICLSSLTPKLLAGTEELHRKALYSEAVVMTYVVKTGVKEVKG